MLREILRKMSIVSHFFRYVNNVLPESARTLRHYHTTSRLL